MEETSTHKHVFFPLYELRFRLCVTACPLQIISDTLNFTCSQTGSQSTYMCEQPYHCQREQEINESFILTDFYFSDEHTQVLPGPFMDELCNRRLQSIFASFSFSFQRQEEIVVLTGKRKCKGKAGP